MRNVILKKKLFKTTGVRILFFLWLLAMNLEVNAQQEKLKQVIPPSPEAAAITKYGLYPVSNFTGIPGISIPLFAVKAGGVNIPISLDYHASGVKVDDYASWVGLSWILNAGGAITRTVVGVPDDDIAKGLFANPPKRESQVTGIFSDYEYFYNVSNQDLDSEPDLFSFNFCGKSGKFVFKPNKKALTIEYDNLLIELTTTGNIRITDAEGNIFLFNDKIISSSYTESTPVKYWPVTAWYLTTIIPANSTDTVSLSYEAVSSNGALRSYSQSYQLGYMPFVECYPQTTCPGGGYPCELKTKNVYETTTSISYLNTEYMYVKQIASKSGIIRFVASLSSTDYSGRVLDSIIVENSKNEIIKKFALIHDHFYSDAGANPYAYINDKYRLKLTKLEEIGSDSSVSKLVHEFEYEENVQLPPRKNFGIDEWGYYNGHEGNTTLMTLDDLGNQYTYHGYGTGGTITISSTITPGIRTSNEDYMKAGMLKKIIYPTGGYTQFEFEPNEYKRSKSSNAGAGYSVFASLDDPSNAPLRTQDFTVTAITSTNAKLTLNIPLWNSYNKPMVVFKDVTTGAYTQYISNTGDPTFRTITVSIVLGHEYQLTASVDPDPNNPGQDPDHMTVSASLNLTNIIQIQVQEKGGGLRTNAISSYTRAGELATKEIYKYGETENGEGKMSFFPYLFTKRTYEQEYSNQIEYTSCNVDFLLCDLKSEILIIMDHPFYNASDFGGSKIAYPFVTKYEVGGNFTNGKTTYEYDFELDDIIESSYPDPMSLVDLSWKSGHLISEKNFKLLANDEYQCIKEKTFTYTPYYIDTTFGLKVGKKKIYNIQDLPSSNTFPRCGEDFNKDYYYFEYPLYSAAKKLTKSTEKDYSENINGLPVVTETNYFYENLQTLLQTRTESVNSAGETIKNIYKYPHDFVSQSPYAEMVIDRHIWSPVMEQLTYKGNNVFLKSAKTNYNFWNNGVWGTNASSSLIVPQSVDLKNLSYTLETRLNLNSYDANGNLLEQQKTNDVKEVYLWGYEGQYPVAKILNSTYSIASGYVTQSVLDNPSDDATLRSHLANLRNIPGTMVTTYTYKPLVGMTSQTDPAGRTTYYEYDSFNRLKTVRDQDGKVVKTIDYQYQQTNNQ